MNHESHNPRSLSRKSIFKIFVTYWALFTMLATLTFFTVGSLLSPTMLVILSVASIAVPLVATLIHVWKGKKDGIDDIAKRMH
jgi:hypothetical protein